MRIWAVCKDPGGTAGMLPVVAELRSRGHAVMLITNGWASVNIAEHAMKVSPDPDSIRDMVMKNEIPDLLLTSTCSTGGTGMRLIPWLKGVCPIVALQDLWGGHLLSSFWEDKRLRPDHVLVNDCIGEDVMLRAWWDIEPEQLHVVGFPAMDHYVDFSPDIRKLGVEMELGLHSNLPILLFVGGGTTTGDTLKALVSALNAAKKEVTLIVRPHPRMRDDFFEEALAWDEACNEFLSGHLVTSGPSDIDDAVAVADLVIGDTSTALISASIMRRPVISMLFPNLGARVYHENNNGLLHEFPLVDQGCVAKAANYDQLEFLLRSYFLGYGLQLPGQRLNLRSAQDAAWSGIGGAASLAADTIEQIA